MPRINRTLMLLTSLLFVASAARGEFEFTMEILQPADPREDRVIENEITGDKLEFDFTDNLFARIDLEGLTITSNSDERETQEYFVSFRAGDDSFYEITPNDRLEFSIRYASTVEHTFVADVSCTNARRFRRYPSCRSRVYMANLQA